MSAVSAFASGLFSTVAELTWSSFLQEQRLLPLLLQEGVAEVRFVYNRGLGPHWARSRL